MSRKNDIIQKIKSERKKIDDLIISNSSLLTMKKKDLIDIYNKLQSIKILNESENTEDDPVEVQRLQNEVHNLKIELNKYDDNTDDVTDNGIKSDTTDEPDVLEKEQNVTDINGIESPKEQHVTDNNGIESPKEQQDHKPVPIKKRTVKPKDILKYKKNIILTKKIKIKVQKLIKGFEKSINSKIYEYTKLLNKGKVTSDYIDSIIDYHDILRDDVELDIENEISKLDNIEQKYLEDVDNELDNITSSLDDVLE